MGGEFYVNRQNDHLVRNYLRNPNKSIIIDLAKDHDTLLLSFACLEDNGTIKFDFFRVMDQMDVNKILLRDLHQAWYHKGLANILDVDNFDQLVEYLEHIIPSSRIKKLIVLGYSAGGYAAILFGLLTKFNVTVLSFAPQTILDEEYGGLWKDYLGKVLNYIPERYLDLVNVFQEKRDEVIAQNKEFHLYYGRFDKELAMRLHGVKNVFLHECDMDDHNVPAYLLQKGEFAAIIQHELFSLETR